MFYAFNLRHCDMGFTNSFIVVSHVPSSPSGLRHSWITIVNKHNVLSEVDWTATLNCPRQA
jgi:hypothetical protein